MQAFDMGNINHRVLELFMKDYQKSQMPLPVCNGGLFENEVLKEIGAKYGKTTAQVILLKVKVRIRIFIHEYKDL